VCAASPAWNSPGRSFRIPAIGANHQVARHAQRGTAQKNLAISSLWMIGANAGFRQSQRKIGEVEGDCHRARVGTREFSRMPWHGPIQRAFSLTLTLAPSSFFVTFASSTGS
jgi:hypothetical protein